jgi:hypothetical protein
MSFLSFVDLNAPKISLNFSDFFFIFRIFFSDFLDFPDFFFLGVRGFYK